MQQESLSWALYRSRGRLSHVHHQRFAGGDITQTHAMMSFDMMSFGMMSFDMMS